jgi:hypothetical protein
MTDLFTNPAKLVPESAPDKLAGTTVYGCFLPITEALPFLYYYIEK